MLKENYKACSRYVASIHKMQFIFNRPLPKKFIKKNYIAKVRYHIKKDSVL